jgi:hypothetical protein
VVFEEPDFCGEAYVLEKGLYGSPEDWGAMQPLVASVMPIVLVNQTSHKSHFRLIIICLVADKLKFR